jgi:hypothetical protein
MGKRKDLKDEDVEMGDARRPAEEDDSGSEDVCPPASNCLSTVFIFVFRLLILLCSVADMLLLSRTWIC